MVPDQHHEMQKKNPIHQADATDREAERIVRKDDRTILEQEELEIIQETDEMMHEEKAMHLETEEIDRHLVAIAMKVNINDMI